jgi:hypothetical protein
LTLCSPFASLNLSVCDSVALIAMQDEVGKLVRFLMAFESEMAKWNDVVNVRSRLAALLAGVIVPILCLSFLGLPVGAAAFFGNAIDVLRVLFPDTVGVSAFAGAILAASVTAINPTLMAHEGLPASLADKNNLRFVDSFFDGGVLALTRTVHASPVFCSARGFGKHLAAMRARTFVFGFLHLSHALNGTAFPARSMRRLYVEGFTTGSAINGYHCLIIAQGK